MAMRFDPTINLGHVLTFCSLIVGGSAAYGMMDKRVAVLEEAKATQVTVDRRQDADLADAKRTTREDLKEISSKLDRLLLAAQYQQFPPPGRR